MVLSFMSYCVLAAILQALVMCAPIPADPAEYNRYVVQHQDTPLPLTHRALRDAADLSLDDVAGRNERSTNLSHITGSARKIQMYISNRHLQILPDGTVNGTSDDSSEYTILQRATVNIGQLKIQGVATCQYLCMDSCGFLYGSREFNEECVFNEAIENDHYNRYSSAQYSNKNRTMYLAINKKGQPRKVQTHNRQNGSLGKLATYTRVLTKTVTPNQLEELEQQLMVRYGSQHPLRHRGHQLLCPPQSLTSPVTSGSRCNKKKKHHKKHKKKACVKCARKTNKSVAKTKLLQRQFIFNGVVHSDCDVYRNVNKRRKCESARARARTNRPVVIGGETSPNFQLREVAEPVAVVQSYDTNVRGGADSLAPAPALASALATVPPTIDRSVFGVASSPSPLAGVGDDLSTAFLEDEYELDPYDEAELVTAPSDWFSTTVEDDITAVPPPDPLQQL